MRPLRWKSQYAHGDRDADQRHKRLLGCFNQLMETAGQREHCQELDQFLTKIASELDNYLRTLDATGGHTDVNFYTHMVKALPLQTYETTACRNCGLCDLAKAKIAEHLKAPLDCLNDPKYP